MRGLVLTYSFSSTFRVFVTHLLTIGVKQFGLKSTNLIFPGQSLVCWCAFVGLDHAIPCCFGFEAYQILSTIVFPKFHLLRFSYELFWIWVLLIFAYFFRVRYWFDRLYQRLVWSYNSTSIQFFSFLWFLWVVYSSHFLSLLKFYFEHYYAFICLVFLYHLGSLHLVI